jgi:hypothetical protein
MYYKRYSIFLLTKSDEKSGYRITALPFRYDGKEEELRGQAASVLLGNSVVAPGTTLTPPSRPLFPTRL